MSPGADLGAWSDRAGHEAGQTVFFSHLINTPQAIANNVWTPVTLAAPLQDPEQWINAGTVVSSFQGSTCPVYSVLSLPAGVYLWTATLYFAHNVTGQRGCYLDFVDLPTDNGSDSVFGAPGYWSGYTVPAAVVPVATLDTPAAGDNGGWGGFWHVTSRGAPMRVVFVVLQTSGAPLNLNTIIVQMVRL